MKVRLVTKLSEGECRKRVDEDATALMADAKLMCDLEAGGKGYSIVPRAAFATLKKTVQANLLAAKVMGSNIDWKQVIGTMEKFTDKRPFEIISYDNGVVIMNYDDDYVQYIGMAKFKFDEGADKKDVIHTTKKVLEASEIEEIVEPDCKTFGVGISASALPSGSQINRNAREMAV